MALLTVNGVNVIGGTIILPLEGIWTADLVIDQTDGSGFDAETPVTIEALDGVVLKGIVTPDRAGDFLQTIHVRVTGGKGGMSTTATARGYAQPGAFVSDVLKGFASDAGETLSTTIESALLGTNLTAWATITEPVSQALRVLLYFIASTAHWRILEDGTLWCGVETWPVTAAAYQIVDRDPTQGTYTLGVDSPAIVPGITIDGIGKINRVEHRIDPEKIRTQVWTEIGDTERGLYGAVAAMVRQESAGIDYFTLYDCQLASQSSDLTTVDLVPQDVRIPGLQRVPLRHGLPGCKVQVSSGAFLRLGWDRGNPQYPYACLWNGGETVQKLQLGGTIAVAREGDSVDCGSLLFVPGTSGATLAYVAAGAVTPGNVVMSGGSISEGSPILETG